MLEVSVVIELNGGLTLLVSIVGDEDTASRPQRSSRMSGRSARG
jgi:hypothetical protein